MLPELNFGSVTIPTYFAYLSLLFCFLILLTFKKAQNQKKDLNTTLNLCLIIMLAGFFGARLVHIVYEQPALYLENPEWIYKFWYGGFVWYGGAIAAVAASALYLKKQKHSFLEWADFFAPLGSLGYALGRISCFLNGCCHGRSCDFPWAVRGLHPTQLYASIFEFFVFLGLTVFRHKFKRLGDLFFTWVILHSIGRIVMEYFRDDFRGDLILGLSISTWVSLVLIAASSYFLKMRHSK